MLAKIAIAGVGAMASGASDVGIIGHCEATPAICETSIEVHCVATLNMIEGKTAVDFPGSGP